MCMWANVDRDVNIEYVVAVKNIHVKKNPANVVKD